jgi:O-antigen/teichoic acid export membrane protein
VKRKIVSIVEKYGIRFGLDLPYFVGNGFWVSLRLVFETLSGLLLTVVFARLTTQEMYGQYQFILTIFSTISILSIPGLNASITKSAAEGNDRDYKKAVRTSFFWSFLGVPIIFLIGGCYYLTGNVLLGIAFMIAAVFFPFFYAPNTWYSFLQGKKRFDVLAGFGIVQSLMNALATISVVYFFHDSLIAVTLTYLISYTFFNVLFYFKSLRYVEGASYDEDTIPYGFFLTKLNVIGTIANNIDRILIAIFLSPTELAIYSVGMMFTNQVQSLSKGLLWIVSVKAIRQKILDMRAYVRVFALGIVITVVCLVGFQYIIPLLFSEKYVSSIFLSEISIAFFPFYVVGLLYENANTFDVKKYAMIGNSIISPIIRIILAVSILPLYGIAGLAFLFGFRPVVTVAVLSLLNVREGAKTQRSAV